MNEWINFEIYHLSIYLSIISQFIYHIYKEILFSLKKGGGPATCNNMDKPGGHYAK